MKRLALLTVALVLLASGCGKSAKLDATLEPLSERSKTITLSSLKGKVVLIDFWATWCGPCHMTMPTVQRLYTAYRDKGFTVAAITREDRATVEKFLQETPLDYPIYLDGLGEANLDFGVQSIPLAVLLGKNGQVLDTFNGAPLDAEKLEKEIQDALRN